MFRLNLLKLFIQIILLLNQVSQIGKIGQCINLKNILMVFSFDGFGYRYLDPDLTPNLYYIANKHGVSGHMLPTFSTKTLPNHHSIATGLFQDVHGIVHNEMYDPLFKDKFHDNDEKWWDNKISTPIYVANQLYENGRYSSCSPWIGCHSHYHRNYRARYFRRFNQSFCMYEQFQWSLKKIKDPVQPANLVMIYIPQPDMISHRTGPKSRVTFNIIRKIDQFVGHVKQTLEYSDLHPRINVIILADHGLADVRPYRSIVLDSFLNSSWYEAFGGNPLFNIMLKPKYANIIFKTLTREANRRQTFYVYKKFEKIFDRLHYKNHRRILDLVVIAREGWNLFKDNEQLENARHKYGQHGYDNLSPEMRPLFVAYGPAFRQGYYHKTPFVNIDLYPLMLTLLGINPNQYYHQGNLTNVINLLQKQFLFNDARNKQLT